MKSGIAVLAGSSDTGKSSILRQLAIAVVKGDDKFLGFKLNTTHKRAIYVSTEDDRVSIAHLLNRNKTLGENSAFLKNLDYVFNTENLVDKLDKSLNKKPVDLVIIDALTDLYGGDLNQSNKVRTFMNEYFNLADKHGCLFIFLHHTGKRTEELAPSKNNLLGSQGIEGKARQVIELRRDPQNNLYRHLCIVKGNYISDDRKTSSFKLEFKEDQTFENTGDRVPFEVLVNRRNGRKNEYDDDLILEIVRLHDEEGFVFNRIPDELEAIGFKRVSHGTANKLYNDYKSEQVDEE
jgi:KaiC/GvpD/RAD55 family RecA-like ATPase